MKGTKSKPRQDASKDEPHEERTSAQQLTGAVPRITTTVYASARGSQAFVVVMPVCGVVLMIAALLVGAFTKFIVGAWVSLVVGFILIILAFLAWLRSHSSSDVALHTPPAPLATTMEIKSTSDGNALYLSGGDVESVKALAIQLLTRVYGSNPLPAPVGRIDDPSDASTAVRYSQTEALDICRATEAERQELNTTIAGTLGPMAKILNSDSIPQTAPAFVECRDPLLHDQTASARDQGSTSSGTDDGN